MKLKETDSGIIYGSAIPKKGEKSSTMPYLSELPSGDILAVTSISSYFDAPDGKTHLLRSEDGGKSFVDCGAKFTFKESEYRISESTKITAKDDNNILAIGYGFVFNKGDLGPGNSETGGLLDCPMFFSESHDGGKTFSECKMIKTAWGYHTEASSPVVILANGNYVTPISAMADWEGGFSSKLCGRLLLSTDGGNTWSDDTVTMELGPDVTVWEQRLAITESGKIVDIAWNENIKTGELYNNHAAISTDGGKSFSSPIDTGIHGQATGICALGGERVLTLHAMRRDVDKYGVLACIVNLENNKWDIEWSDYIWEPEFSMEKRSDGLEVFSMLRFGQPSAIMLRDGTVMYTHWQMENDVCKTIWKRFKVE